jgi:predicted esterase
MKRREGFIIRGTGFNLKGAGEEKHRDRVAPASRLENRFRLPYLICMKPGRTLFAPALAALVVSAALLSPLPAGEKNTGPPKAPRLDSKKKAEIKDAIKAYFKSTEPAEKAALIGKLEAVGPVSKSAIREFTKLAFRYLPYGTRLVTKHKSSLTTDAGTGTLYISGIKKKKLQPLLIGLHGGGPGVGDGANSEQKWQSAMGKGAICVFPTVIQKTATAWNKEREEKYVIAIIEAVKRTCRVDTNRIYLVGHSMGGFGTWSIGSNYADIFAAISPNAGGPFVTVSGGKVVGVARGQIKPLYNTPVYFFHSTDDAQVKPGADQYAAKLLGELRKEHPDGYEHVYKEYTDIGHGMPRDGVGPILKYLFSKKRDPYPKKVIFEPCRSYKRLFAWVEIPLKSPVSWICAEYDRKKNRITVKTIGGDGGFVLYINPQKMVDMKKPVTVTVNGKERWSGYVQYSAAALLHSLGELRDPARYYTARISFP